MLRAFRGLTQEAIDAGFESAAQIQQWFLEHPDKLNSIGPFSNIPADSWVVRAAIEYALRND